MFCTKCGEENDNDAQFCKKCGNPLEPLDDNVSEEKERNKNSEPIVDTVSEKNTTNKNSETIDEIIKNIEFEFIIIGSIASIALIFLSEEASYRYEIYLRLFSVITGSAIAGYLSKHPTKYSLIYGLIIGGISSMFFGVRSPIIPITMGLIGGYLGKYLHDNYG